MGFQAFPINSFHKCPLRAYPVPGTVQGSECTKMQRMWPHSMRSSQGRGDRCVHSHALCEKCFNGRTIRVLWKQSWELMTNIGTSKEEREKHAFRDGDGGGAGGHRHVKKCQCLGCWGALRPSSCVLSACTLCSMDIC